MTDTDADLNRLFHDMANQSSSPELPLDEARRRQRAIGGMRALHRRIADEQGRRRSRRRYVSWGLVAAAVALGGTALAGTGLWHWGAAPVVATRQRAPEVVLPGPTLQPNNGPAAATAQTVMESAPAPAPAPPPVSGPTHSGLSGKLYSGDLEEVNRLFANAKRARREHRDVEALGLFQRLLSEHPRTVLAQEASIERFRALARLGRNREARDYASAYLAQYPRGYAADEARRLVNDLAP